MFAVFFCSLLNMGVYFLRRFLLIIPTFLGLTLIVFAITRIVPGGPIEMMLSQAQQANQGRLDEPGTSLSKEQLHDLEIYYGFDKPIPIAYANWILNIFRLDLGQSTRYVEPVWGLIKERLPISIFYGLMTIFITYLICIPLGIFKAIHHGSIFDSLTSIFIVLGYAIPNYIVGVILLVWLGSLWEWFPMEGFTSDEFDDFSFFEKCKDIIYHATLPLIAYLSGSFAFTTLLMKNSLMDHLSADYVRTALQKGLSFPKAVLRHAFRNSLIPIATHFGNNISFFITGSFLIETIFNIDGIGLLGYESIVQRDYPVVMGILVISSLLFFLGNILSDICVALIDPRIRFE